MKYSINKIWCEKGAWYENITMNSMNIKKVKNCIEMSYEIVGKFMSSYICDDDKVTCLNEKKKEFICC